MPLPLSPGPVITDDQSYMIMNLKAPELNSDMRNRAFPMFGALVMAWGLRCDFAVFLWSVFIWFFELWEVAYRFTYQILGREK